jgi:hypothetical protein
VFCARNVRGEREVRTDGVRNLALIRESGSTARVLNLALVHERFSEAEDYLARPMFRDGRLNKGLYLKHVVRSSERVFFNRAPINTTKVVLPFSAEELRLGGRALMVGERNFERRLREAIGAPDDTMFQTDLELLLLLDSLPSFDPFLMRERLRQSGFNPAQCYFDMSEADITRIRSFVSKEIEKLVGLAYANGGASARELSAKLAEKLMTDETARPLDPLRQTLRLSDAEYREGVFAWKGFLYYKWISGEAIPMLTQLSREILSARINGVEGDDRKALDELRQRIIDHLGVASRRVQDAIGEYAAAFAALSDGRPAVFRDFLLRAPTMFIPIGEAIGVIKHIQSFWRFRFPQGRAFLIPADEAFEVFTDFEATLGGMEVLGKARAHAPG